MSPLIGRTGEAVLALAAEQARTAGRARRAEDAGVSEMARLILREARVEREQAAFRARGESGAVGALAGSARRTPRRRRAQGAARLAPSPLAARRP